MAKGLGLKGRLRGMTIIFCIVTLLTTKIIGLLRKGFRDEDEETTSFTKKEKRRDDSVVVKDAPVVKQVIVNGVPCLADIKSIVGILRTKLTKSGLSAITVPSTLIRQRDKVFGRHKGIGGRSSFVNAVDSSRDDVIQGMRGRGNSGDGDAISHFYVTGLDI